MKTARILIPIGLSLLLLLGLPACSNVGQGGLVCGQNQPLTISPNSAVTIQNPCAIGGNPLPWSNGDGFTLVEPPPGISVVLIFDFSRNRARQIVAGPLVTPNSQFRLD